MLPVPTITLPRLSTSWSLPPAAACAATRLTPAPPSVADATTPAPAATADDFKNWRRDLGSDIFSFSLIISKAILFLAQRV